jgi:hypothetical protein
MVRMHVTIAIPSHLSDGALIAEVTRCARDERHATAQLVAHLAELDARQLYLGAGKSSLFAYCHDVLGLSADAAYNRVEAARVCRLFPQTLAQLDDGSLTVTSVRLLSRHLTAENHRELLAAASRRSKREVEELVAVRFPKPDTPTSVRKVPERTPSRLPVAKESAQAVSIPIMTMAAPLAVSVAPEPVWQHPPVSPRRPPVKPLVADRYEIRFTASAATRDKLKVAQDLLRHAIPSGDIAAIFDRALSELIEAHSRRKMAVVRRPVKVRSVSAGARGGRRRFPTRCGPGQTRRVEPGRRPMRVRRCERPSLQRTSVPGIPPRRALRRRRSSDDRRHPAPVSRTQRLRGGRILRGRSQEPCGRWRSRAFKELRCCLGLLPRSGTAAPAASRV